MNEKNILKRMATYIFTETVENTTTGNWFTSFSEVAGAFGVETEFVKDNAEKIISELCESYKIKVMEVK